MTKADIARVTEDFENLWQIEVMQLAVFRAQKMSQSKWADLNKKSLRTIQRFEQGKVKDPMLMFAYKRLVEVI